jgi:MFS family permease
MFRSLKYRNFRLFFYGQFVSLIGSWVQQTAQSWLVYRLTKDPLLLGLVAFVGQFPVFLFGFYAGFIVDRHDHLRIVRLTQTLAMLQAVVLAVLALTGQVRVWHVFALSLFLGIVYSFDIPARQVLIGELVDAENRHNAIALNSMIVNASRIIGPACAGLVIGWTSEGWCFAVNALSYLSVIVALLLMNRVGQAPPRSGGSLWEEVGDGLAYAMGKEPIRLLLGLLAVFSLAGLPVFVLLPVFAEEILRSGARGMGILSSFSGLGATLGALVLAGRRSSAGIGSIVIEGLFLFGLALIGLAFSTSFPLSCGLFFLVGYSAIRVLAGTNMALQELAGDRYRGRIMSFYSMLFIGVSPIGSFMVGGLTSRLGVAPTVCLQAVLCMAAGLLYMRRLPRLLDPLGRPEAPPHRPGAAVAPI